ncbi:MAG: flap endonuclease [Actinomycetia bacterium]|nr:flap endonuclease [Actinomycetes bacterium]
MEVHLVDGTYELFRNFYSPRGGHTNAAGEEVGAVRGVLRGTVAMLDDGITHIGVATDHVIESFRNDLWEGYKDGSGIDPDLWAQFPWLEDSLEALGVTVWPMVDVEADDALAAAAKVADEDERVQRVVIATPDKDLAQCVVGDRVVQYDRRAQQYRDAEAVVEKYGVPPESIPDWLGLVGDSADGFPGLPGWGAKSAAKVLTRYGHIDQIPHAPGQWDVPGVRGAAKLAATLADEYENALLFRRLAVLETDVDVGTVDEWEWTGPTDDLAQWCDRLDAPDVLRKVERLGAG